MDRFPRLETEAFWAFVADNSALGVHRAGYNGVASLVPKHTGNNVFVPTYAGLNYETIALAGLGPYPREKGSKFEPRSEPMHVERADAAGVRLVQPETSHAHVSASIAFTVEEPHYLHQHVELTFHRRFCGEGEANRFESLWASYIHMPSDLHVYLKPDRHSTSELSGWFGITRADHAAPEMQVRPLPDGRELDAAGHLAAMAACEPLADGDVSRADSAPMALPRSLEGPLEFYYGLCEGSMLFLMMFRQPERVRLAYSPCGAGKQPAWNPAWDYVLRLDDARLDTPYSWDACLVVKPYEGRADVLREVARYLP